MLKADDVFRARVEAGITLLLKADNVWLNLVRLPSCDGTRPASVCETEVRKTKIM